MEGWLADVSYATLPYPVLSCPLTHIFIEWAQQNKQNVINYEATWTEKLVLNNTRESKDNYRRKLEYKLENNDSRDVGSGMREITSFLEKWRNSWEKWTTGKWVEPVFQQV